MEEDEIEDVEVSDEVVEMPELVDVGAEPDVDELEVELLEIVKLPFWYKLSLLPAPQYSVALSEQVMEQSVAAVDFAPLLIALPHQHSPPYSMPAYV